MSVEAAGAVALQLSYRLCALCFQMQSKGLMACFVDHIQALGGLFFYKEESIDCPETEGKRW